METTLRLSEAIRLGSLLRPQAYGALEAADGSTCAMGAAMMAVGHKAGGASVYWQIVRLWPWAANVFYPCPAGHTYTMLDRTLPAVMQHLNDEHEWARERIADWVESIEPAGPDQDLIAEKAVEIREVETCCL